MPTSGEPILHLLALAELLLVVEVGEAEDVLEFVGGGELGQRLIDLVADFGAAPEREEVVERSPSGTSIRLSLSALALSVTYFTNSSTRM